jgi:hypothetical protein
VTVPEASAPAPEKAGVFEDFIDIFFSPAKVFARRATASPMVPFLVVAALCIGLFIANRNVYAAIMDAEMTRSFESAMKQNPQITADQMAAMKAAGGKFATVGAFFIMPVSLLVLGLVTWLVGKILGGTISYGTALLVASFSWMPRVVEAVLASVQGMMLDTSRMTSRTELQLGIGRLLDPATTSPALLQLSSRVDLFTLWVTVLLALGLVHAGKVPKGKSLLAGILVFLIGSIPVIWAAARS